MMFRISILILLFFISCNSDSEKNKIEELPKSWEEGIEINLTDKFNNKEPFFDLTISRSKCVFIDGLGTHKNKLEFSFSQIELDSILLLLSQANFLEMKEENVDDNEYMDPFPGHRTKLSFSIDKSLIKRLTNEAYYMKEKQDYDNVLSYLEKLIFKYIESFTFFIDLELSDSVIVKGNRIIFVDHSISHRYNEYYDGDWGLGAKLDLIAGNKAVEINVQLPDEETFIYDTVIKFQSKPNEKFLLKIDFVNGNYISELMKVEE